MTDREFAVEVVRTLQAAGYVALFAGGCVRDELLSLVPADYDVATSATPDQVQQLFRRTVAVGAAFGVIEVIGPKIDGVYRIVQVATFRSDGAYVDGRRPITVTFTTPEEDAARRDFTINGLFRDPLTGEVRDYVGGQADLQANILRAIGDPIARFTEDKLRLLRAVRMATRFDLTIESATMTAIRAMATQLTVVSAERIAEELRKLLAHRNRAVALSLLRDTNLLPVILPESVLQESTVNVFDALSPTAPFTSPLAILLDGMPPKAVAGVCRQLKLSNDESERIGWLVAHRRDLAGAQDLRPSALYPLLTHPGVAELLDVTQADGASEAARFCDQLIREKSRRELDPPALVSGDDLCAAGYRPGPGFKSALAAARAAQLDGEVTTRQQALDLAVSHLR